MYFVGAWILSGGNYDLARTLIDMDINFKNNIIKYTFLRYQLRY